MDWDFDAVVKLLKQPHTIPELMRATGMSKRSSYRYLERLRDNGYDVVRREKGRGQYAYAIQPKARQQNQNN